LFINFDTNGACHSYCPFASHNKSWQDKNFLEALIGDHEGTNKAFNRDELRQHVRMSHANSWCGEGLRIFLDEMYPSSLSAKPLKQKRKRKTTIDFFLSFCLVFPNITVQIHDMIAESALKPNKTPHAIATTTLY